MGDGFGDGCVGREQRGVGQPVEWIRVGGSGVLALQARGGKSAYTLKRKALLSSTLDRTRPMPDPNTSTPSIQGRAEQDLHFIRETMERSAGFTAVSGRGGMVMGALALAAAALASQEPEPLNQVLVWVGVAPLAAGVNLWFMRRKAAFAGLLLLSVAGRGFAWGIVPPVLAGALLTVALIRAEAWHVLPGLWLILYGVAVLAGGMRSLPVVRGLGVLFLGVGVLALSTPGEWGNAWMAVGFGGLNLSAGWIVARRHGG